MCRDCRPPATTSLAGIVKEFGLLDFPFAVAGHAQANVLLDGPLPMPFAELYGALESKAVDGQENPYAVILSNKFHEGQRYVNATHHVYAANILLVSKRFWDKLSPAEQRMMQEAAQESMAYQRQVSRAAALKAVTELQAKGMQYNEVGAAELQRMAQIVKPVTDRMAASYDPEIVKLYQAEMARVRK